MKGAHLLLIIDTSIMLESGTPPDKSGVLYGLLQCFRVITFCSWYYLSFFRDGVCPFNTELNYVDCEIHRFMIKINKTKL